LALPATVVLRELSTHGKSLMAATLLESDVAVIEAETPLLRVGALLRRLPCDDACRPCH
jgi:hypothetical protein